jgi:hypothetical protein
VLLFGLLLVACGTEAAPPTATPPAGSGDGFVFVGTVAETQAFIGLVRNATTLTAFVCDGTPTQPTTLWGWFSAGPGSSFDITNAQGTRLTGSVTATGSSGTLTLASGQVYNFSAAAAQSGGVFRAEPTTGDKSYVVGWIVQDDGQQRGGALEASTARAVTVSAIRNIKDGTSNIQDGTSNTIRSATLNTSPPLNINANPVR